MAMAPIQTTYTAQQAAFVEGMIPDMRTPGQDVSRNVEPAAGIGFGKPVGQGAADRQVRAIATGQGTKFIGVTVLDSTQENDRYAQYATARVRTKGPVVVKAAVNVAAGDPAYVVPADGSLTNVASGNTKIGMFETTGAAGVLVVLNLQ